MKTYAATESKYLSFNVIKNKITVIYFFLMGFFSVLSQEFFAQLY